MRQRWNNNGRDKEKYAGRAFEDRARTKGRNVQEAEQVGEKQTAISVNECNEKRRGENVQKPSWNRKEEYEKRGGAWRMQTQRRLRCKENAGKKRVKWFDVNAKNIRRTGKFETLDVYNLK